MPKPPEKKPKVTGNEPPEATASIAEIAKFKLPSLNIQVIPIGEIKPYWRNPRDNDEAVEPVIESIKRYGYAQPIAVDKKNVIIAGHTRYRALSKMGVTEIAVVVMDLSEAKAKEYRIVDNKTNEIATWDIAELLTEMREFENLLDAQVFFPDEDLSKLLEKSVGQEVKEVTKGDMDKAAETNVNFTAKPDQLEVMCPHCDTSFWLNRKDVLERE